MEKISILLGKGVQAASKLRGNGGSALPGLVIERTNPKFIRKVLEHLPYGVVVISGTNGKTTTTKIVTELLHKQGLKVFTNDTGSNFVRGVISAIIKNISITGKFDYDIAVLELDEAHAVKFSEVAPITNSLLLNVQRDQLDRFGEIDYTAELLQKIATATEKFVALNREDPRVCKIKAKHPLYFGLSAALAKQFPSDDNLIVKGSIKSSELPASVILDKLKGQTATYKISNKSYSVDLALKGSYNAYNAAGALAICHSILPDVDMANFVADLAEIQSAFGRGEVFNLNGAEVELLLVKNPSAFQLSLANFVDDKHDYMIAINDNVADGHDVSWLWNVDFTSLPKVQVVSGIRATDMALRLKYDGIECDKIQEDLAEALKVFVSGSKKPKRIFTTYTAMLELRKLISGKSLI